jgi:predicted glycoside hydrolase/deacetylase ChbG (UPF0249 family)
MNRLLLHADDLGFNEAVTHGIIEGFANGLLTSTSILANAPAAKLAIDEWRRLEQLRRSGKLPSALIRHRLEDPEAPFDLGVHLNLTQGRPLIGERFPDDLLDSQGRFLSPCGLFLKLLFGGRRRQKAIDEELSAQVAWLLDHDMRPTHLNGHQYIEMMPVVSHLLPALAQRFCVASVRAACEPGHLRSSLRPDMRPINCALSMVKHRYAVRFGQALHDAGIVHSDAFFGTSHAGRIDLTLVRRFLWLARPYKVSEIAFHPGQPPTSTERAVSSDGWHDPLSAMRAGELQLLCSPQFAELLVQANISLTRYHRNEVRRSIAA